MYLSCYFRKIMLNFAEQSQKDDKYQFFLLYNKPFTIQDDIDILLNHPEIILVCDLCERKLNHAASVLLVMSSSQKRDFCFTCFLKMRDLPKNSIYYVRPNLYLTLTEDGWSIMSEMMMLNGLQRYGYCEIDTDMAIGAIQRIIWTIMEVILQRRKQRSTTFNSIYQQIFNLIYFQHTVQIQKVNCFIPPCVGLDSVPADQRQQSHTTIQAYNSKREEHLFDYDPQAESLVADLQFLDSDTPQQVELKYLQMEEYNIRVKQRQKRQKFVAEHRLLSEQYSRSILNQGKVKAEARQTMSCFSRFMTFQQSEDITNYLTLQTTLKATIKQLMRHRRRLNDPLFEKAFQAMSAIREKRSQQFYRGAAQLKVHKIDSYEGKREGKGLLQIDEMKKRVKVTPFWEDNMKATIIDN